MPKAYMVLSFYNFLHALAARRAVKCAEPWVKRINFSFYFHFNFRNFYYLYFEYRTKDADLFSAEMKKLVTRHIWRLMLSFPKESRLTSGWWVIRHSSALFLPIKQSVKALLWWVTSVLRNSRRRPNTAHHVDHHGTSRWLSRHVVLANTTRRLFHHYT